MSTDNLEFLGKDKERLGEVSMLFPTQDDLDSFLKIIEDAANMEGSTQEKREYVLKNMLGNAKFRQYLKVAMPDMFKEGLAVERGKNWKMSMKDIEKATGATEEELLDTKKGWMGSEQPMADLKFLMESEGLNYKDALKVLEEAQTKKDRKDIWYEESLPSRIAMSVVAPFNSEKLSEGEVPDSDDAYADIVMAPTNIVPWGKGAGIVSGLVSKIPKVGEYIMQPFIARGLRYGAEFMGPGMVEGALHNQHGFSTDDITKGLMASGRNSVAGAFLAGGSQFLRSWGSKSAKKALKDIEDALKETVYPEEVTIKLQSIRRALKNNPESITEADVEFLRNFDQMRKLKLRSKDLNKIGTFDPLKQQHYLKKLKADKTRLSKLDGRTLFENRTAIRSKLDEYEKAPFDRNPGVVTFTDVVKARMPGKEALESVGYGEKAGLGPVKKSTKVYRETSPGSEEFEVVSGNMKDHHLISGESRIPLRDYIQNPQIDPNFVQHTDFYYPRPNSVDKYMEEFLSKNPEIKLAFDAGKLTWQDVADLAYKRVGTRALGLGKWALDDWMDQRNKEKSK